MYKSFFVSVCCFILDIMEEVASRPFAVDPQMLMSIVKGLYSLNPGKFRTGSFQGRERFHGAKRKQRGEELQSSLSPPWELFLA